MIFIRDAQYRTIRQPKCLEAIKPKGPKQDSQHQLRSPMTEGGEP